MNDLTSMDFPSAYERGKRFSQERRFEEAIPLLEAALRIKPDAAKAMYRLGEIYFHKRFIPLALDFYQRALEHGMDPHLGAQERWMCRMMLGEFEAAWQESDWLGRKGRKPGESFSVNHTLWNGKPLEAKNVMVRCYHGLGDTIQFLRYIPFLRSKSVTVEVQPMLFPLFRSFDGIDLLVSWDDGLPRPLFDVEIECMELPYAFRSTPSNLPSQVPYIRIDCALTREQSHLFDVGSRVKVGLVWASSSWNRSRSIPLSMLDFLADLPGFAFFSLQKGAEADQVRFSRLPIIDLTRHFDSVLGTAAAILKLDLIVSVDTMTAHLAGALGKPACVLLPYHADWRWMVDREDSPWYPTLSLLRR